MDYKFKVGRKEQQKLRIYEQNFICRLKSIIKGVKFGKHGLKVSTLLFVKLIPLA